MDRYDIKRGREQHTWRGGVKGRGGGESNIVMDRYDIKRGREQHTWRGGVKEQGGGGNG